MDDKILIAVITAGSAFFGVIISQIITLMLSYLDKRHKKQILLRQKYEEMMLYFQESLAYFSEVGTCKTLDQLYSKSHSVPAQKAMGLAMLYFPKIAPLIESYIKIQVEYYQLVVSSFNPNIQANAAGQVRVHNKEKIEIVENNLFQAKNIIIDRLKKNVKKYAKA